MPCQHCDLSKDEHGMFTDHKYEEAHEDHDEEFEEAFSIPSGLSGVSVGGKRHKDQIKELECPVCPVFDKVHAALKRGY
ncbi:hypothetical protein KAR91_03620 [Candidatus Pacearchaeota archaeon]|nr:hypothetical protein [Candidatus Pacearchaeota archaeon]